MKKLIILILSILLLNNIRAMRPAIRKAVVKTAKRSFSSRAREEILRRHFGITRDHKIHITHTNSIKAARKKLENDPHVSRSISHDINEHDYRELRYWEKNRVHNENKDQILLTKAQALALVAFMGTVSELESLLNSKKIRVRYALPKKFAGCYERIIKSIDGLHPYAQFEGKTLWHWAVLGQNMPILKYLAREYISLINTPCSDGNTPLDLALELENQKIIIFLMEKGAYSSITGPALPN